MGIFKKLESLIEKEFKSSNANNQPANNSPAQNYNNCPPQPHYQQPYQQPPTPTSSNYGTIKRCPNCGSVLDSFAVKCPDCGYEIRNIAAVSSFAALSQRLDSVDSEMAANRNTNQKRSFLDSLLGDDSLPDPEEVSYKKAEIIKTFPIPNTREDIIEFLMNAIPLSKNPFKKRFWGGGSEEKDVDEEAGGPIIRRAWKQKSEQIIFKAKILFKNDPRLLSEISRLEKELKN